MRILVDVDGVLADYVGAILAGVNETLGTSFRHEDVTQWNISEALGIGSQTVRDFAVSPDLVRGLEPIRGAKEGFKMLDQTQYVYVVTCPGDTPTWTSDREAWLWKHFQFPRSRVVHTYCKHIIQGDMLIDDNVDNVRAWAAEHKYGVALLWDRPWNQRADVGRYTRVKSWEEIAALIERIEDPYMSP